MYFVLIDTLNRINLISVRKTPELWYTHLEVREMLGVLYPYKPATRGGGWHCMA